MKLFKYQPFEYNAYYIEDQPLPGMERMCGHEHRGWYCGSLHHPENPNQHYYVHR